MEIRPPDAWTLRPLSLGELLDRAITLTVRNFPVLALIALAYALPQAVFQYFGSADQSQIVNSFVETMRDAAAGKPVNYDALIKAQRQASVFNGWTVMLYVWLLVGLPMYSTSMVYAVSRRYRGLDASAADSYRFTLRHWGTLIGISLVYFVIAAVTMVVLLFASLSIIFALSFLGASLRNNTVLTVSVILIGGVTILMAAAIFVVTVMGYIALHFAWMANVLEGTPLVKSITSSFGRIFGKQIIRRSAMLAAAYFALAAGYGIFVFSVVALLGSTVHSNIAGIAIATLMQTGVATFFATLFMVFYYDTRVRREGLDLELAAAALPATAAPAPATA